MMYLHCYRAKISPRPTHGSLFSRKITYLVSAPIVQYVQTNKGPVGQIKIPTIVSSYIVKFVLQSISGIRMRAKSYFNSIVLWVAVDRMYVAFFGLESRHVRRDICGHVEEILSEFSISILKHLGRANAGK